MPPRTPRKRKLLEPQINAEGRRSILIGVYSAFRRRCPKSSTSFLGEPWRPCGRLIFLPFFSQAGPRIIVSYVHSTAAKAGPPIKVLVVDDEAAHHRGGGRQALLVLATTAPSPPADAEGMAMLARDAYEVIVTDLRMKDSTGLELLAKSKELLPDAEVILVTGHGTVQSAVEAMQQGAFNYLLKPLDLKQLRVGRSTSGRRSAAAAAGERRAESPARREVRLRRGRSATARRCTTWSTRLQARSRPTDATVLIQGRNRHRQGTRRPGDPPEQPAEEPALRAPSTAPRSARTSSRASCSATSAGRSPTPPPTASASSSTPTAARCSSTKWATCRSPTQIKLLRVLESGEITRVGSNEPIKVNVRILSATNRDSGRGDRAPGRSARTSITASRS